MSPDCLSFKNQIGKMAVRSKRDVDILSLGERQQFFNRFLAAYAGLLVAAVTSTEEMRPCINDPDTAGLHAPHRILLLKSET